MTEDEAFNGVRAWLLRLAADAALLDPARPVLGEIIRAHPDGPRPGDGPYVSINLLSAEDLEEGHCEEMREFDPEDGEGPRVALRVTRAVEYTFRIDVFSSRPMDWIRLFRTAAMAGDFHPDLAPLAVRSVGNAQRVPDLNQANWEGRARFDVAFAALMADEMLIDVIEGGTVDFEGSGGAVVSNSLDYERA